MVYRLTITEYLKLDHLQINKLILEKYKPKKTIIFIKYTFTLRRF